MKKGKTDIKGKQKNKPHAWCMVAGPAKLKTGWYMLGDGSLSTNINSVQKECEQQEHKATTARQHESRRLKENNFLDLFKHKKDNELNMDQERSVELKKIKPSDGAVYEQSEGIKKKGLQDGQR